MKENEENIIEVQHTFLITPCLRAILHYPLHMMKLENTSGKEEQNVLTGKNISR